MAQVRTRKRGKTWSFIFEAGQVNVKPTSLQIYQSLFNNHISLQLGEIKVRELTPAILDKWIRDLQKAGLSFNTISTVHAFIHQALNYAVHPSRLISSNPAAYIKVPKNAPKNIVKRHIITPEQFRALLEKYPFGTLMHIPLLLLYYTGMRLSEVLGLAWSDIDFEAKKIKLSRQIVYLQKRGYFFTTPKTESSKRNIFTDDYLIEELKRWQSQQIENEKLFGGTYVYTYQENDGHIVRRAKGLPAPVGEKVSLICVQNNGKLVLKEFAVKLLRSEGLNTLSFRHTYATRLIENGVISEDVSGRLGHKNSDSTFNVYVHNTPKVQEKLANIFTKIMQMK